MRWISAAMGAAGGDAITVMRLPRVAPRRSPMRSSRLNAAEAGALGADGITALRGLDSHRFIVDDVSIVDPDVPEVAGYRQVTDAHLLTLARRSEMRLVTFDAGIRTLADGRDVELLTAF